MVEKAEANAGAGVDELVHESAPAGLQLAAPELVDREADQPGLVLVPRLHELLQRLEIGGQAGALLVRAGGRRVFCYCVKPAQSGLPAGDRTAHLLLALRQDESGFATVANLAFAGAPWRLRRRVQPHVREALAAAVAEARRTDRD